ncbi:hypothetical protein [Nitratifractor sp.]
MAAIALTTLLSGIQAENIYANGQCKLTNLKAQKVVYHGSCQIHQSKSSSGNTVIEIKMGLGEPFLFAGKPGSSHWSHGPDPVKYTDNGNGGAIFVWDKFALAVTAK